jgi:fimbrial chaperone protein
MQTMTLAHRTSAVSSRRSVRLGLALALVGLTLGLPASARAASFSVNPTQLLLSGDTKSALVSLRNETDQPVRFQLSVSAWAQAPDGQMILTPTEDVVFFPALLTLKPREERKVRVGANVAPGTVEKTYRLFVEELPPLEKAEGVNGVAMLTKMGIPIFIRPIKMTAAASIAGLGLKSGRLVFRLQNTGTVFIMPQGVRVRGLDQSGAAVVDQQASAWYVLAGGVRAFDLPLSGPQCAKVRSVVVEVQVSGTVIKETLQTPGGACGQ